MARRLFSIPPSSGRFLTFLLPFSLLLCFECRFVIAITMPVTILKLLTTTVLANAISFVIGQPPSLISESKQRLLIELNHS
jgi:hypothetical protein